MRNKLFLPEGEIERILSLHKGKINESRGGKQIIMEGNPTGLRGYTAMCNRYYDRSKGVYDKYQIANITKQISYAVNYNEFLGAGTHDQMLEKMRKQLANKGNLYDFCAIKDKYEELNGDESLADALIGDVNNETLTLWRNALDKMETRTIDEEQKKEKEQT